MRYYVTDDLFKWIDLVPGDSVIISARVFFESATEDREIHHRDERVLVIASTKHLTHSGLTTLTVWMLGRSGFVYVRRNFGGDPSKTEPVSWL